MNPGSLGFFPRKTWLCRARLVIASQECDGADRHARRDVTRGLGSNPGSPRDAPSSGCGFGCDDWGDSGTAPRLGPMRSPRDESTTPKTGSECVIVSTRVLRRSFFADRGRSGTVSAVVYAALLDLQGQIRGLSVLFGFAIGRFDFLCQTASASEEGSHTGGAERSEVRIARSSGVPSGAK